MQTDPNRRSGEASAPRAHHVHPGVVDNPVRAGILFLPVSAVLFLTGAFVRGPFRNPEFVGDAPAFARWLVSPAYSAGWLIILAAMALLLFGVFSLTVDLAHGRGRNRAFLGLLMSVPGLAISLAVGGSFALGWPVFGQRILAGDATALAAWTASYTSAPLRAAALVGAGLYVIGSLPISTVIWESRSLPRWAGLLYLIHAPLLCITATMYLTFEHLGAFFLLLAGGALAWGVRREEEVVRHLEHHAPLRGSR
jgi:hypothetical protein